MSEQTHTPGPWELMRGCTLWGGMDLKMVEHQDEDGEWRTLTRLECDLPNARLIAAAPDLLGSLEDMLAVLEARGADGPAMDRARAAIAKAKGLD